jgi:hypothetical protein
MAHRSVCPLVFCHSKLKLSNMIISKFVGIGPFQFSQTSPYYLFIGRSKPPSRGIYCVYLIVTMAPVVRIEPNGCQALLAHDDAINDLQAHGWDIFIRKFEGYNLAVAQAFAQMFDGFRAKVGDVQLEVTEDSIAGQQDSHRKAKNGSKMLNWKTCLGACSWSLRNLHASLKVFLLPS